MPRTVRSDAIKGLCQSCLNPFISTSPTDLAIDLSGTAKHPDLRSGQSIVLDEPSVVPSGTKAAPQQNHQAVGKARPCWAKGARQHKTSAHEGRRIADFTVTDDARSSSKMVHPRSAFSPARASSSALPCGSTQVERRAIRESALVRCIRGVFD